MMREIHFLILISGMQVIAPLFVIIIQCLVFVEVWVRYEI